MAYDPSVDHNNKSGIFIKIQICNGYNILVIKSNSSISDQGFKYYTA